MAKVHKQVKEPATDTSAPPDTDTEHFAIVKSNLDLAWVKIQDALQQEAEGHNLWIEGTLELINILDDARGRLGDQAFRTWLVENGYGEDRITRHDRAALLNMARHLNVTRKVLEQTHRRSWRLIWEEEIQPQLPTAGQPPDGESTEGAPAVTRRPKKNGAKREANAERKPEWLRNIEGWFRDQVAAVNAVTNELNKIMEKCNPEQRKQLATLDPNLLLDASQSLEKKAGEFVDFVDTPLEKAADTLIQKSSRVVVTPAPKRTRRASQPGA